MNVLQTDAAIFSWAGASSQTMRRGAMTLVALFGTTITSACPSPRENLDAFLDEAAACDKGDTCAWGGSTDCSCGRPINADAVDAAKEIAATVSCCEFGQCTAVDCAMPGDAVCVDGRCVEDDSLMSTES